MGYKQRLDRAFDDVPVLPLGQGKKYVLFSDCHRGNGTHNDNFLKNQHLYLAAMRYYLRTQYTYIELGDGDELWENRSMDQIEEVHGEAFELLSRFYRCGRLYMIYGNHDIVKKQASFSQKKCACFYCATRQCELPLFPGIVFYSGLILEHPITGNRYYLTHGHQASILNSLLWPLSRFLVRYVWKPLEQVGVLDPTSAAKNYRTKQRTERKLAEWAGERKRILITGHTHRPMVSQERVNYMNTGSCVHPCFITCIEIENETITLVKWYMDAQSDGNLVVERRTL
ncbi:MAG: metallophosphoesterase family protein [bacterium]|nr:metallophosphoesterase family protein [bacterium]